MRTEDLKEKGLTDEQIAYVMSEHGKSLTKVQRDLETMTADRDKEKGRADTAESTLKGFDGVDINALNASIADWKNKAEKAEQEYAQKIADRDFNDLLKESITSANGLNHKAIISLLDVDALKNSKNQKEDIANAIKGLTEAEDSKMLFKSAKETPHFTSTSTGSTNGGATKESISKIKDYNERINAIARNLDLYRN